MPGSGSGNQTQARRGYRQDISGTIFRGRGTKLPNAGGNGRAARLNEGSNHSMILVEFKLRGP